MTTSTTGRFVWHELHTGDRASALKFYTRLFGWETKDVSMGPGEPYGLCLMGGRKDIAGIQKSMAPAGVPPHWLPYLAVDDVDASAKKVTSLGGKIAVASRWISRTSAASPSRWTRRAGPSPSTSTAKPYPEEPKTAASSGSFCWEELHSSDPAVAAKFYAGLFGYAIEEMDMGPMGTYRILKSGDKQRAGIMKLVPESGPMSFWLTYVAVKDVDESTRNAKEIGAKVFVPPQDIPKIGRFSVIADPTGAGIALFKGAPTTA